MAAALKGEGGATKVEEARQLLEKLLARNPHSVGALFNLGILYNDALKRPSDAKPFFQRFLSDAPADSPSRPDAEHYLASLDASTSSAVGAGGAAAAAPAAVVAASAPAPAPNPTKKGGKK